MALASGDDGTHGVASVELVAASLERAAGSGNIVKQSRLLRGYASDILRYCDPAGNPTSYHACQSAAEKAIPSLLMIARNCVEEKDVRKDALTDVRVTAWEALARVCFGNSATSSAVADTNILEDAVRFALRPINLVQQQMEQLAALQLIQALSAAVPEAPILAKLLPCVASVATQGADQVEDDIGGQDEHHGFRAVRMTAIEVLLGCSYARSRRTQVGSLLPAAALALLLKDTEQELSPLTFTVSLLLANLCELRIPGGVGSDGGQTFGDCARQLWERTQFFSSLGDCFSAALRVQPWPLESGVYHRPWKLACTCLWLASAGHRDSMQAVVAPLTQCVEMRGSSSDGFVDADVLQASRLAAAALLSLAADARALSAMQSDELLPDILRAMQDEEPAARDLLQVLETGSLPPHCGGSATTNEQFEHVTAPFSIA